MDKLRDMDLFVRVVKNKGLAAAGREVDLSPASMSARINDLEARYNTRLLNRSTRHVSVTEIGQQFYESCINILADMSEVEAQLLGSQESLTGSLRVTATSDTGRIQIMTVLSKFVKENPGITPYLHLDDGIVNITENGFDCAIRYGEMPDSSLIARKLAPSYRVLCASPTYLKRKGRPTKPEELTDHDCLITVRGIEPMTNWFFNDGNAEEMVSIKAERSSNDGSIVKQWAIEGAGIALKSYREVCEDIKAGRLETVLDEFSPDFLRKQSDIKGLPSHEIGVDLYVVYPSRKYLPLRVKAFIEALVEYFDVHEK